MALFYILSYGHAGVTVAADALAIVFSQALPTLVTRAALFGQIGYSVELLLAVTTLGFGFVASIRCSRYERDTTIVANPEMRHPNDESQNPGAGESERDLEVTIRLEAAFLRALHRHRCIVTIRRSSSSPQDAGREVWYARGGV